jgi:hypothetical protein
MKKFLIGLLLLLLALGAAALAIHLTGNTMNVIARLAGPPRTWDESVKAPAPDYADRSSWAAWPGDAGLATSRPAGVPPLAGEAPVDVFFVHPTGYMKGADWNSPLDADSQTEENTRWMMINQASAYNGSGRVYAPRYREASIFRYLGAPEDIAQKAMDLAYSDVVRAFEHFIAVENKGRPFIVASHSQGSQHAFRLLKEHIDGTDLQGRLVAAYVIGTRITNADAATLKSIKVCDTPEQTGCLIHWAAMGEGGTPPPDQSDLVCVNPLTWKRDGTGADAGLHKGGVAPSGTFSASIFGNDAAKGVVFEPLQAPKPGLTGASCRDGFLWVNDLAGGMFDRIILPAKNYHGLDYPLFHMDIRANVAARVAAFGAAEPKPAVQE